MLSHMMARFAWSLSFDGWPGQGRFLIAPVFQAFFQRRDAADFSMPMRLADLVSSPVAHIAPINWFIVAASYSV